LLKVKKNCQLGLVSPYFPVASILNKDFCNYVCAYLVIDWFMFLQKTSQLKSLRSFSEQHFLSGTCNALSLINCCCC